MCKLSQIFTEPLHKKCDICQTEMQKLQAGRFRCNECGFKDDNF